MRKLFSVLLLLIFYFSVSAQETTKTYDNPAFLKLVQGTWIFDQPGEWWHKAVINNNSITLYNASPKKGRWNDEREGNNEIIRLKIIACYKVVKSGRSDYDGRPYTKSYSIIETTRIDRDNHVGPYFSMSNGKLEQWGLGSQDNKNNNFTNPYVTYRKSISTYNPWDKWK